MAGKLNNKVRHYRELSGLTQVELAEKVSVTRQTIISIEKGNYAPSVILALTLAKCLKVTVEELFYIME